ncbi:hypothetical protein [Metabacillus arenae]|uniref:Uncharacterized protein n=1 Tax=Metabacillus arenae TaxID=2771434 RepID=A0A926NLU1_9BACI|nr:hypothetical protein [Metabacillus arenae]MBD1382963.1 hypothetical protein [Metabacillus arenae]
MWYAAIVDPILLLIVLGYYKWVCKLEKRAVSKQGTNGVNQLNQKGG